MSTTGGQNITAMSMAIFKKKKKGFIFISNDEKSDHFLKWNKNGSNHCLNLNLAHAPVMMQFKKKIKC